MNLTVEWLAFLRSRVMLWLRP